MKLKSQFKDGQFALTMLNVEKLFNATTTLRDKCIVGCLYYVGMRRGEVIKLDIRDIDFETGRIKVVGKFNKIGVVPVGSVYPQFINDLRHYIGNRKDGLVFKSSQKRIFEISRINQILSKIGVDAGLTNPNPKKKHINPHSLRHSVARHLKDLGFSIEFIKNYMRHDSIKTTMDIYGMMSINDMELLARRKRGLSDRINMLKR